MNWQAIGAVGEVVGAIAVLISFVFLAIQIRRNTRALTVSHAVWLDDLLRSSEQDATPSTARG